MVPLMPNWCSARPPNSPARSKKEGNGYGSFTIVQRVLVIPCSGIGKVHGLVGREATYGHWSTLMPDRPRRVCLALLGHGRPETHAQVAGTAQHHRGRLPQAVRRKNVELAGGTIAWA